MAEVLFTLRKILLLEKQKEYSDTAISGGFRNFSNYLKSKEAVEQIQEIDRAYFDKVFNSYSSKSYPERQELISELIILIDKRLSSSIQPQNNVSSTKKDHEKTPPEETISTGQDPALFAEIQSLWGIGENNKKIFNNLGIFRIYDLLRYFPRRYQDYSQLKPINELMYGEEVTVIGTISQRFFTRKTKKGNLKITETAISDSTGFLRLTWFNQPFIQRQLKNGDAIVISGKVDSYLGRLVMNNPDWELMDKDQLHTNRIVPIYPLKAGISQRQLRKIIHRNLEFWSKRIKEYLPKESLKAFRLPSITSAIQQIHFPSSKKLLEESQKRFAVEEILFLQLGVMIQKIDWVKKSAAKFKLAEDQFDNSLASLPYQLTNSQLKAIAQIRKDLNSGLPMNRLLQGDVGSGKTVVSKIAIDVVINGNGQTALMAPTAILAEQHYVTFLELLTLSKSLRPKEIALLTGSTSQSDRKEIIEGLKNGKVKVLIGTHALIEDPVVFDNLSLVIIDEQHRFGVDQRLKLR